MEIAVKATYAHLVKDESLVQNSDKLYIVEFHFDQSWDGYAKSAVFEAGGVQQPPVALTDDRCIIPAENWSGRAQTVKDNILLADEKYWYIVCADADCFMAVSETGVKADNITVNGQVTFHCEVTPTENLTIYILRLEVEQNNE